MGTILASLLSNWRTLAVVAAISATSSAAITGYVVWKLHNVVVTAIELKHQSDLTKQAEALNEQCNKDKQLTMEVSNETQSRLADLQRQLAAVKRVQPNRCVPIASHPTGGNDADQADTKLRQQNGVYSDTLYDFAGEAEQDSGIPLDNLQQFVCKLYASRGQPLSYQVCKQ